MIELQKFVKTLQEHLAKCDAEIQKISPEKLALFRLLRVRANFLLEKPKAKDTEIVEHLKKNTNKVKTDLQKIYKADKKDSTEAKETAEKISGIVDQVYNNLKLSIEGNKTLEDVNALRAEISAPLEKIANDGFPLAAFFAEKLKTKQTLGNDLTADQLYNLYSWFKQSVFGDVYKPRPSLTDLAFGNEAGGVFARGMWDNWKEKRGELRGLLQRNYIELVINILTQYKDHASVSQLCKAISEKDIVARCDRMALFFDVVNNLLTKYKDEKQVVEYCKLATVASKNEDEFFKNANTIPKIADEISKRTKEKESMVASNASMTQDNNNNGNNNKKVEVNNNNNDKNNVIAKPSNNSNNNNDGLNNNNNNNNFLPGFQAKNAQTKSSSEPTIIISMSGTGANNKV